MKERKIIVCKIEVFPGDKIECKNCPDCVVKFDGLHCRIAYFKNNCNLELSDCPSEGKRDDCPYIKCRGIILDLKYLIDNMFHGDKNMSTDDSIKFIKACEDNQ